MELLNMLINRKRLKLDYINYNGNNYLCRWLDREKERVLYLIESISVSSDLTVGTVLELCDRIAKAIGGELYGTVNFDFTVHDKITFEMMVEQFRN